MPRPPSGRSSWDWLRADGVAARAGHVFLLSSLAVVQPLWALLGRNAEFYLARNADRAEILLAALLLLLVPPAVVMLVELAASRLGARAVSVVHLAAVGGFGVLIFSRVFAHALGRPAWLVLGLALGCGAGLAAYYATTRGARRVMTALTPLPLALLALFALGSDVRPLVLPRAEAAVARIDIPEKPPVVFLIFDEFPGTSYLTPDLAIDPDRAPNLAAFAKTATWYRNASTVHEVSEMAIPAILTGHRFEKKVLPTAANHPVNLFSVFRAGGYRVSASESLTRICTAVTCGGQPGRRPLLGRVKSELKDLAVVYGHDVLPRGVARRLPDISLTWGNFGGRAATADPAGKPEQVGPGGVRGDIDLPQGPRFDQFVGSLTATAEPTLHYLHALVPHAPFDHLPNGKQYAGRAFLGIDRETGVWAGDPFFTEQAEQRNLLNVGYADWQIGRVVTRLKEVGLFDKALVVLVGDHGSANRPGVNRRAFAPTTLGDIGSVPMFVKLPGQTAGRIEDKSAETIDLLPTIAAALRFTLPKPVDGHDLADPAYRPARKLLVNQWGKEFVLPVDFPQRRESVERIYGMFAHAGDRLNLFAMGPYKSLVGEPVSRLRIGSGGDLTARLDDPELWTTGAPAGMSPCRALGKLAGLPPGAAPGTPTQLLVAVGDRIVATSRSYDASGTDSSLSILVPDEALAPGHAPVRLYAVTGPASAPALTLVRVPGAS